MTTYRVMTLRLSNILLPNSLILSGFSIIDSQLLCMWLQNGDFLSFFLHLLGNSCFVKNLSPFILFQCYCGLIIIYNLITLILKLSRFYQWEPLCQALNVHTSVQHAFACLHSPHLAINEINSRRFPSHDLLYFTHFLILRFFSYELHMGYVTTFFNGIY